MASNIDATKPTAGTATTESVRQNFAYAKSEIETLQGQTAAIAGIISAAIQAIYPIGSLYISTLADNPNTILGFGTWQIHGAGRVMVCKDAAQAEFDTIGKTGGAKTHTLTTDEIPAHAHNQTAAGGGTSVNGTYISASGTFTSLRNAANNTNTTGGGQAHNNIQPYIVINAWLRTA